MTYDFIFVHGTGVRGNALNATFRLIDENLKRRNPDYRAHCCDWGGQFGSSMLSGGRSMPEEREIKLGSITQPSDPRLIQGIWSLLYQDPLFELNILTLRDQGKPSPLGPESPGESLDYNFKQLAYTGNLQTSLEAAGIDQQTFQEAQTLILQDPDYQRSIRDARKPIADYTLALSRALLAQIVSLVLHKGEESALFLQDLEPIAELISLELSEQEKGLSDNFIVNKAKDILARIVTQEVRRQRFDLSGNLSMGLGDILMYQARGKEVRGLIRELILKLPGPVVLIGHSLGGIACVDLCLEEALRAKDGLPVKSDMLEKLKLLVTVGSQAPALYELNALIGLKYDPNQNLPATFPKWLNIYDRNDFLSYVGEKLFPKRIIDVEVQSNQPFPLSHGAYWKQPQIWDAIVETLRKL